MNQTSILLFLSLLPIILISLYVYNKDRNKESTRLLLTLFCLGIFSCFLVIEISDLLETLFPFMRDSTDNMSFLETIFYAFIGVAFTEETCKWLMVYLKGYFNKEFDEVYDIIVYSVFVSLGFAFFENCIYIFNNQNISIALLRAISAVPGHACDAIFMGYYLSMAKQFYYKKQYKQEKNNLILSILIPTILHGIYDYCLMSGYTILVLIFIVFVITLYSVSTKKLKELARINQDLNKTHRFCSECGSVLENKRCPICKNNHT